MPVTYYTEKEYQSLLQMNRIAQDKIEALNHSGHRLEELYRILGVTTQTEAVQALKLVQKTMHEAITKLNAFNDPPKSKG